MRHPVGVLCSSTVPLYKECWKPIVWKKISGMSNYHCRLQCINIENHAAKKQTSAHFKAKDTKAKPIGCKPKANVHLKDYE